MHLATHSECIGINVFYMYNSHNQQKELCNGSKNTHTPNSVSEPFSFPFKLVVKFKSIHGFVVYDLNWHQI